MSQEDHNELEVKCWTSWFSPRGKLRPDITATSELMHLLPHHSIFRAPWAIPSRASQTGCCRRTAAAVSAASSPADAGAIAAVSSPVDAAASTVACSPADAVGIIAFSPSADVTVVSAGAGAAVLAATSTVSSAATIADATSVAIDATIAVTSVVLAVVALSTVGTAGAEFCTVVDAAVYFVLLTLLPLLGAAHSQSPLADVSLVMLAVMR